MLSLTAVLSLFLLSIISIGNSLENECYMNMKDVASSLGYDVQVHIVRTQDDYLLELHRIRDPNVSSSSGGNEKAVVFMQHGLFSDSFSFGLNLRNESAAFVFASKGFDVWLGNSRGSPPSQKHAGLTPDDERFWNFSWQEMAALDLPSCVDHILNTTKQESLYYMGHSQGTVIMFAQLSENKDFNRKIRQFHALAPVATVSHIGGMFRLFGYRLVDIAKFILYRLPQAPLAIPKIVQKLISYFCSLPIAQDICSLDIGFVDGRDTQLNTSRIGVYLCHFPVATSIKDLLHWIQVVKSKKLEKFDYGADENMKRYSQTTPPVYNLSSISTKTYLYWSKDDILADAEDIRETILAEMKGSIGGSYELHHFTHLDFILGLNATNDVYLPIINIINKDIQDRKISHFSRTNRIQ